MKIYLKILITFIFFVFLMQLSAVKVYSGWFKHYGGTDTDRCYSIQQTTDGGYILAGATYSFSNGTKDFAIYKLDSNGDK